MQNKGVIRLFAIVFALACLWELSFTFFARSVEKDAEAFANGDPALVTKYLDSMSTQEVLLGYTYKEVKAREINLGLDLKGGMNVILEVSVKDIIKGIANAPLDPMIDEALKNTDLAQTSSQESYLSNFFVEFGKLNNGARKLSDPALFGTKALIDKVGFDAADEAVVQEITNDVDAAVKNVYTVLRARIDQFGVIQPNIQPLENSGRILVELPGVKDPARVKKLLQSTAELEFWRLYEGTEVMQYLISANERLKTLVERPKTENTTATESVDADAETPLTIDEPVAIEEPQSISDDSTSTAEVDTNAVETPDSASALDQFNPLFEVFGFNYNFETNELILPYSSVVGFAAEKDTSKINKYLRMSQIRALLPSNLRYVKFMWTAKPDDKFNDFLYLLAIQGNRNDEPDLSGDVVTDARSDFDNYNNPMVSMTMNGAGSQKWQEITREAAAQEPKRSIAVVLDNLVYSYPTVQNEISGGNTQITGSFTQQEADDLSNILKAGKLPAPAKIIQSDVVGPTLGQEAIDASVRSFAIALFVVMLYMIFYYGQAGVAAVVSLLFNTFFIFGIIDASGIVLSLPGMAGIVLTIGMAVDANVLIFERIREELSHGKGLSMAIKDGYKNSYSAIIDANVTTLLTGVILFAFGTGPIRGFANTLIIGILTSLFCGIFITRLVFEFRLGRKKDISFFTNMTKDWYKNINVSFLQKRKMAYIISGIVIAIGVASLFTKGLNQGVDFVGGRSYQVRFDQSVSTQDIASSLSTQFVGENGEEMTPSVKTIGNANQVIITTKYRINESGTEVEEDITNRLYAGVKGFFTTEMTQEQFVQDDAEFGLKASRQVGPTIADDIKQSAIWSIIAALIVIFLYILIRFRKWQFSAGAVAALTHDVLFVLGAFSILDGLLPFQLEIDQAFIAAILTVIGYSLNDTVVVFDRIREYNAHYHKKRPVIDIINSALNGTLSRTFNTSLTTLFVLLVIFIFGGEVIRGFMFALLLGVAVGTYSSLFIATPVMFDLTKKEDEKK
ncbi:MAG: protein translocase subunit SecDF [Schleiferiaceae bacterium]|jgi:SecD/SecF fusion protein|nr:protein translocase subunit SecDF [Schleiferiaceae bacterium]